jgi:putative phosphoribosyl transferase
VLRAPLSLVAVCKAILQTRGSQKLHLVTVGALAEGRPPRAAINTDLIAASGATSKQIDSAFAIANSSLRRGMEMFRPFRLGHSLAGSTAVLVDDGMSTGATIAAALASIANESPAGIVVAVPVATAKAYDMMQSRVDEVVSLVALLPHGLVGKCYQDFRPVSAIQAVAVLHEASARVRSRRDADHI